MAETNHHPKQPPPPPPPPLSQTSFSSPAVNNPPSQGPILNPNSNDSSREKGKSKAKDQSSTEAAEYPPPAYPQNPNVQLQFQSPVRWVYNYDHTDPLNFGFMFPVAPSSSTTYSMPDLASASVTSVLSASGRALAGVYPPSPPKGPPDSSTQGQVQWSLLPGAPGIQDLQFVGSQQSGLTGISQQLQYLPPQTLPHRYSSNHDISPPSQQPASSRDQIWFLPPYDNSTPQDLQSPSEPDSRGWLLDESRDLSYSFNGSVSSGRLFTPHVAATISPTMKRKRSSGASSAKTTPYLHTVADRQLSTLCSRCKIYEKLSNFPGLCSSCLQVSFNTWPSALGTRTENLESLVLFLMPAHMEEILLLAPSNIPRSRTWRMLPKNPDQKDYNFGTLVFQDRWTLSKQQAESTRLFGVDYAELADIAQIYQLSLPRPNKSLEASCTLLITVCELYKSFVNVSEHSTIPATISIPKLLNNIRTARITIRHAFQQLQALAVSPSNSRDRQDWFPAFLSATIMAISAISFLDILIACPSPYKEQIWGAAWHDRIVEMRNGGYGMLVALLKANSNGINPLKLDCWSEEATPNPFINVTPESYSPEAMSPGASQGKKRRRTNYFESEKACQKSIETSVERERNILLGINSPAALQGVLALKAWNAKYHDHLKQGEDMFSKSLYMLATMKPVAGLWRVFELE